MSTAKQTKLKINEMAKDLGVTGQELADFLKEKLDVTKKPAASLADEEINYILESFSQNNQVASFDEYFATRNDAPAKAEKPKAEKKTAAKKETKTAKDGKASEKASAKTEKTSKEAAEKPEKKTGTKSAAAAEKTQEKKKTEKAASAAKNESKPAPVPKPLPQNQAKKTDRFNAQQVLQGAGQKKSRSRSPRTSQPSSPTRKNWT